MVGWWLVGLVGLFFGLIGLALIGCAVVGLAFCRGMLAFAGFGLGWPWRTLAWLLRVCLDCGGVVGFGLIGQGWRPAPKRRSAGCKPPPVRADRVGMN